MTYKVLTGTLNPTHSLTHLSSAAVKEFGLRESYFSYYKVTAHQQTTPTADACQLFITDFSLSVLEITRDGTISTGA